MNCWQEALEDVGPAGMDKGKGGKYLITPPGFTGTVPEGYLHLLSNNYQGYALLRSTLKSRSEPDIAAAVAYGKRIKLYPLAGADAPPATTFVDAVDVVLGGVIPYDVRVCESLNRFVQAEPWLERDRAMIDLLASIGIEQAKPFKPDQATSEAFELAGRKPGHGSMFATRQATRPTTKARAGSFRPTRTTSRPCRPDSPRPTCIRPTRAARCTTSSTAA